MQPIAPPPQRPRSRKIRENTVARNPDPARKINSHGGSRLVQEWLPFGEDLRSNSYDSVDVFRHKFEGDLAISTSYSDESDERGNIEVQLSEMEEIRSPLVGRGHLGLTPVPLPSSASRRRSVESSGYASPSMCEISFTSNRGTISNRKYVQRKGLIKRNENVPIKEETQKSSRGRRGRSVTSTRSARSTSRVRSSSLMNKSFAGKRKSKSEKQNRSRSRSVVRVERRNETFENGISVEERREQVSIQTDSSNSEIPFDDEIPSVDLVTPVAQCGAASSNISLPRPIHTRNLLATSVYHNQATGIWITTINMSQKETVNKSNAAKYLKAFSFQTEREARESGRWCAEHFSLLNVPLYCFLLTYLNSIYLAYANAPAKMAPYDENPFCFICSAQFSVFKRASHCRNCGVCVCNGCTTSWSKVCIPETYNIKGETTIKVCKSCDSLSKIFKRSILESNYDDAITVYNTGNINLRCPFMTSKGSEAMLPIHCAAEGGSLEILQWLVEIHFCPLKRIRTSNRNKSQHTDELITTSKGRSVLEIAMANQNVDILRYLVNDKNVDVTGVKDLGIALKALEAVLRAPPYIENDGSAGQLTPAQRLAETPEVERTTRIENGLPSFAISGIDDTDSSDGSGKYDSKIAMQSDDEESVATTVHDAVSYNFE